MCDVLTLGRAAYSKLIRRCLRNADTGRDLLRLLARRGCAGRGDSRGEGLDLRKSFPTGHSLPPAKRICGYSASLQALEYLDGSIRAGMLVTFSRQIPDCILLIHRMFSTR